LFGSCSSQYLEPNDVQIATLFSVNRYSILFFTSGWKSLRSTMIQTDVSTKKRSVGIAQLFKIFEGQVEVECSQFPC